MRYSAKQCHLVAITNDIKTPELTEMNSTNKVNGIMIYQ